MFGHSIPVSVVARLSQGLSGAITRVLGLAMIADTARWRICKSPWHADLFVYVGNVDRTGFGWSFV
jgi:hypothetical protein